MRQHLPAIGLALAAAAGAVAQNPSEYRQSAPADAFVDGSPYAYYGSENEWSRRMFSQRAADRQPKRRGQRQLLAVLDGRPEEAARMCRRRLADDPEDAESLFVLTVALTRLGDLDAALLALRQALDAGLPFGRFVAGPRDLLGPLAATPAFRALAAERGEAIVHGPMLGALSDRGARVWVRAAAEGAIRVRAWRSGAPQDAVLSAASRALASRDYTAVVALDGLAPDAEYDYAVLVDGAPAGEPARFRTLPATGAPAAFRIAFGGGAGYTPPNERIWSAIAADAPAAVLLLGDNVYVDLPEMPGAFHRYTYYRRQSRPEFRALVRSAPVFTIWDDHDAAIDDAWLGPHVDAPAWKRPTLELFQENWNNPDSGDRDWPGGWYRFAIADVDFFMLDGRVYRTNPFAESPSMLGPVQKRWLLEALAGSRATFKVVVSPVPWELEAKPGSRDTWNGFRDERAEIFGFLAREGIEGVVLMSADRHRSEAWKIPRPGSYPLYELSSSRLTNVHFHEPVPGTLFTYNATCSFGRVSFDTTREDPALTYEAVSIDGEVVGSLTVRRSELR